MSQQDYFIARGAGVATAEEIAAFLRLAIDN